MKTYRCEEMMCNGCVSRIDKGLNQAEIAHQVDLDNKTVTIEEDSCTAKAIDILDDLGFTAVEA